MIRSIIALLAFVLIFAGQTAMAQSEGEEAQGHFEALWQTLDASGTLRSDYFTHSRTFGGDSDLAGATFDIKAVPKITNWLDGLVEWRATAPDLRERFDGNGSLREAYVTLHFGNVDLRLGKQIVAWGRADGINPTDNLTPQDYTILLPLELDQRFGTVALKADYYLTETLDLSVFTTPFFEPSKVALPPSPTPYQTTKPAVSLSNSEVGVKLDQAQEGFDWSVSYFHGFSLLPEAGVGLQAPLFKLSYDRVDIVGADFARNFGRFGFRGEIAYEVVPQNAQRDGEQSNLYWVLGVDRTFLENLNVNFQGFGRWVPDFHDASLASSPGDRTTAAVNALIFSEQASTSYGVTTRVSDKWINDTLTAEILALVTLSSPRSAYLRPLITYAINDHLSTMVGAEVYLGSADTQFGLLRQNSGPFVELRYGF